MDVFPDLATFGKTIANGVPMAALIGKKEIMEEAKNSFISSTNWTEEWDLLVQLNILRDIKN